MTDNFKQIESLLDFSNKDEFYFIQILLRRKEAKCTGSNNKHRCIKAYYVNSLEYLKAKEDEIKKLCAMFNARAYIHLTRRNFKDVAMECFENITKRIRYNQFEFVNREYNSACGKCQGSNKTFLIDCDGGDVLYIDSIIDYVNTLQPVVISNKLITIVPTKYGKHIITTPFDIKAFRLKYPNIVVQTNNPTLLFENIL